MVDYGRELSRQGYVVDLAIHPPETDDRNYNIHLQMPLREVNEDGFGKKIRLWDKDAEMTRVEEMTMQKEHFVNLAADEAQIVDVVDEIDQ